MIKYKYLFFKVKEVTEIGTTMEIKKGKIVALCPASSSAAQNLPALAAGDKVGVRVLFVDYQVLLTFKPICLPNGR